MTYLEKLKLAINASLKAAVEINKIYKSDNFDIEFKNDNSPLTKADLASNEIIKNELSITEIPILSEEGKIINYEVRKNWDELWIVDPIDGTKEFVKRNGEFTVNIALVRNKIPIIGVIYAPVLKKLYFSSFDLGSFLHEDVNPSNFDIDTIIKESIKLPKPNFNDSYKVVASRSHMSHETAQFINELEIKYGKIDLVSSGSSLKLCLVAEGEAQCYPRLAPTMEWDTAAGHAICKYAGFNVLDFETKSEILYNRKNLLNNWFIVK